MGLVINQMFAFIIVAEDGDEAIPAVLRHGVWMPLCGADLARIKSMRPYAERTAREMGSKVTLVHFRERHEIEVIE